MGETRPTADQREVLRVLSANYRISKTSDVSKLFTLKPNRHLVVFTIIESNDL